MIAAGTSLASPKARYLVQSERGRGGFGVAWRATRQADGQTVVLKELRLDRLQDWKAMQLFEREALVMSQISHPNIPAYIEFFGLDPQNQAFDIFASEPRDSFTTVLVQEFIDGQNLEERRRKGKRYTPSELEELLQQMLEVLDYLHTLSPPVIHRDINPKNVVRSESGDFFLVDFGAIQDRLRSGTMLGSTNVGTFGFIPPEQAMGHSRPASDLFALAMTVVVAGTGRLPDELALDDDTGKLVKDVFPPGWSNRLVSTLDQMLEPVVGKRIPTAKEALKSLRGGRTSTALVLSEGGRHRATVTPGRTVQIGRAENVDVRVGDPSVSRYHASIAHRSDGRFVVRDLGSARGTWVDGQRAAETEMRDGSHLRLGVANFRVHFDGDDIIIIEEGRSDALVVQSSQALARISSPRQLQVILALVGMLVAMGIVFIIFSVLVI